MKLSFNEQLQNFKSSYRAIASLKFGLIGYKPNFNSPKSLYAQLHKTSNSL